MAREESRVERVNRGEREEGRVERVNRGEREEERADRIDSFCRLVKVTRDV